MCKLFKLQRYEYMQQPILVFFVARNHSHRLVTFYDRQQGRTVVLNSYPFRTPHGKKRRAVLLEFSILGQVLLSHFLCRRFSALALFVEPNLLLCHQASLYRIHAGSLQSWTLFSTASFTGRLTGGTSQVHDTLLLNDYGLQC